MQPSVDPIKPILIEWFNEHWYKVTVNGVTHYIPSVTTKLGIIDKPNLARWRGDIGNREAELRTHEAGQRGKRLHWAWETALKGGAVLYDPWQAPIYQPAELEAIKLKYNGNIAVLRTQDEMLQIWKLQRQFDILKPHVIDVERTVFDIENNDAGTIDNVLYIDKGIYQINGREPLKLEEGIYINDLKTGSYVDENVWMQLSPYAVMYEQISGMKVMGALVTHTGATIKSGIPGLKTLYRDRETLFGQDYQDYRHASALWMRDHKDDKPEEFQFPSFISLNQKPKGDIKP